MSTHQRETKRLPFYRKGNYMEYIVKLNGDKVKSFSTVLEAHAFIRHHVREGKTEIVPLTETSLPKAQNMRHPYANTFGIRAQA